VVEAENGGNAPAPPQSQVEAGVDEETIDDTTPDETIETKIDNETIETKKDPDKGQSCQEVNDTCKTRNTTRREQSDLRGTRSNGTHVAEEEIGVAVPPRQRDRSPRRKLR